MMSAVQWFDRSIHGGGFKAGEDAASRSVSMGRKAQGNVRLPGGLDAILANPPRAMFIAAAPARLKRIPVDQNNEDAFSFTKMTGNAADQGGAIRVLERQAKMARSSRDLLRGAAASVRQSDRQPTEKGLSQKLEPPSLLASLTNRSRDASRSHSRPASPEGVAGGKTLWPDGIGAIDFLASKPFRSEHNRLEAFSKTQPGVTTTLASISSGGSRSSSAPQLAAGESRPFPATQLAAARSDRSDTSRLAKASVLRRDVVGASPITAGSPRSGIFPRAAALSAENSTPSPVTSFALNVVPRGVAPGNPREARSAAAIKTSSRLASISGGPAADIVPSPQPSTPTSQKGSNAGPQVASVIALRGDVVMDGRKIGRLVAAGQTSAASLPSISSSAVNLKAMPVFAGTSVPL